MADEADEADVSDVGDAAERIEVVLFDLGGVLVELSRTDRMAAMAGLDAGAFMQRWLACPWVRAFDSGRCDVDAFIDGVIETWPLEVGADAFLETFGAWPGGLFPGASELVQAVRQEARVGCLSNTNAYHCERQGREWGLDDGFDETFLSFRTGLLKPDPEAYEHALDVLGSSPERTLFLDDNQVNVDGARAAGLRAELARGLDAVQAALRRYGFEL